LRVLRWVGVVQHAAGDDGAAEAGVVERLHDVVVTADHPRLPAVRGVDQRGALLAPPVEVRGRIREEAHGLSVAFALFGGLSERSPIFVPRIT